MMVITQAQQLVHLQPQSDQSLVSFPELVHHHRGPRLRNDHGRDYFLSITDQMLSLRNYITALQYSQCGVSAFLFLEQCHPLTIFPRPEIFHALISF